jgi:transcriptional regulator with XRE-family HTH domain
MGRKRKPIVGRNATAARLTLAFNLDAALAREYPHCSNVTARQKQFALDSGVSFSTVQRVMKSEVGATLDVLELMCVALRCTPEQILRPFEFHRGSGVSHGARLSIQ